MQNEFARLGQLIFHLKAGREFDLTDEENFTFLDDEFKRITLAMGLVWHEKALGWSYCLDFHAAEAERLFHMLRITQDDQELQYGDQFDQERLLRAYKMLFHILTGLIKRIELLCNGRDINLTDFNVN